MASPVLIGLLIFTSCVSALLGQEGVWTPRPASTSPVLVRDFGFSHDDTTGLDLLFGGSDPVGGSGNSNATWTFDGVATWTPLFPPQSPPARSFAPMAYDSLRGVHVIHGGSASGSFVPLTDTWEFNGTTWTQVTSVPNPGPNWGASLSFDGGLGKMLLYGGQSANFSVSTTVWGLDATGWSVRPGLTPPPPRFRHRMVYDAARGVHVLFGGRPSSDALPSFNDTWEYDALAGSWTQVITPNAPSPRHDHAMTYDATRGVVVLFGGRDDLLGAMADTWEYDGTDWVLRAPVDSPVRREGGRFATNPATGTATLCGGLVVYSPFPPGSAFPMDTWTYDFVTPRYPGSGGDCAVNVTINGIPSDPPSEVHLLGPPDQLALRLVSPGGGLVNQRLALISTYYPQAAPPSGLVLVGGAGPADVWIDPTNAVVLLDGLGPPAGAFVPTLVAPGLALGPYNVPAGLSGNALNLQLFVDDPGVNPVNLSTSNTAVLEFQ